MVFSAERHLQPSRARELARSARLSGLLPRLRLGARRGLQHDLSATSTLESDRTRAALGDDLTLEASLTFDLDRLVFAPEQVRLLAVERLLEADRRKLIEDVVELCFRRKRLWLEQRALERPDPEIAAEIAAVEALLDTYTGGGFGEAVERSRRELRARVEGAEVDSPTGDDPPAEDASRAAPEPAEPESVLSAEPPPERESP
jgi:hypothetical protein